MTISTYTYTPNAYHGLQYHNGQPSNPQRGDVYFDNSLGQLLMFNGTTFIQCSTSQKEQRRIVLGDILETENGFEIVCPDWRDEFASFCGQNSIMHYYHNRVIFFKELSGATMFYLNFAEKKIENENGT